MTTPAVLQRVEEDLQEAQAEIETATTVEGSLGDRLKFGFGSLYAAVHMLIAGFSDHGRKIDDFDRRLKDALVQIAELQRSVHGLKVSRGKAIAAKERALAAIANAESVLGSISRCVGAGRSARRGVRYSCWSVTRRSSESRAL